VVVAAAGNHNTGESAAVSYPAAFSSVVSVAALSSSNLPAYYSNGGKIDLSAPGGDGVDFSCGCGPMPPFCADQEILGACITSSSDHQKGAGTSFACPMVSAAAALLLAQDPGRDPSEVLRLLEETTDPTALGSGYSPGAGWGRLNLYRALSSGEGGLNAVGPPLKVYNWPNPFSPSRQNSTHLTFLLSGPQSVSLTLYDMGGDKVFHWDLDASQTHQGINFLDWDGRNGAGVMVASGVYSLVLRAGSGSGRTNVAVLK
jgi:subtilisin family serine protease